jgi:DNA-binding NtrC family response regulator
MVPKVGNSPSPPRVEARNTTITVLSVSPSRDDHDSLERLLRSRRWKIHKALSLSSALAVLQETQIPVVVCERDLQPETWRDMMDHLTLLPQPPCLIVTSCLADDHLWAEVLNIGAYDVLAKPFDGTEVNLALRMAWLHWMDKQNLATQTQDGQYR